MRRYLIPLTFILGCFSLLPCKNNVASQPLFFKAASVTIYRDTYGVPHIYGPTDVSVVFGFAYAQAEDNFQHIEDNYIRAIGRASEIYGEETFLDDRIVKAMEIVKYSKLEYEKSSPLLKELLQSYADGLNYYVSKNKKDTLRLLTSFEPWHPLAMLRYKYHKNEFLGYAGIQHSEIKRYLNSSSEVEKSNGSNAWALAPRKTEEGESMLLINPHVGFFGYGLYTEGHLHSDEGWNFSGVTRLGFPFPYMGHNEKLGWGHTDNYFDMGDRYAETFDKKDDSLAYKYGNQYRTAVEWKDTIQIKKSNGFKTVVVNFKKTHHGPVLSVEKNKPVAVKLPKYEEGGWFEQWYAMTKAKNINEFKNALSKNAISYMNIVYADADGNIFYIYNGVVPKRNTGFDYSVTLDGSNPKTDWLGYYETKVLPQITNPRSGFVQNCNSNPFFATPEFIEDSVKYSKAVVGSELYNHRARRSVQILNDIKRFSFDQWEQSVTDTRVLLADDEMPALFKQWEAVKQKNSIKKLQIDSLVSELKQWNHVSTTESVAMTLFTYCIMNKRKENSDDFITALIQAKKYLESKWGTWKVSWGEVNRLQRNHWSGSENFDDNKNSVPVAGSGLGVVFSFYPSPDDYFSPNPSTRKRIYGRAGNSYVSIVQFGERVKAKSILFFGQSGHPASPHYFDQALLYSNKQFKPAWFYLDDIEKNVERKYKPTDVQPF